MCVPRFGITFATGLEVDLVDTYTSFRIHVGSCDFGCTKDVSDVDGARLNGVAITQLQVGMG